MSFISHLFKFCSKTSPYNMLCGALLGAALLVSGTGAYAQAQSLPGKGVTVQPIKSSVAEETFQALIVMRALEKLGYTVQPMKIAEYNISFQALANGDATFMATYWKPLHSNFYKGVDGDNTLYLEGVYSGNALQGYLIDKATADKYHITSIAQLQDPEIAKLFDSNGDGKADLTGCTPGWGCQQAIEYQMDAYKLRDTVNHNMGSYPAMIADTIARYREGKPVLYFAWTPYWVSDVLVPGKDVVWLEVPFTALPGEPDADATLPNGKNYGFPVNTQHIVANKAFAQANPAAAKLFAVMHIPVGDINAQNLRMRDGESSPADIERHADAWIKAHQATFDGWIEQALKAAQ
ncbi:Glycine betaine/proline betaine-binding periplasmic protein [Saezia sanguinis]|uniref:Glycine betaine/proline betaine-binding periplasmic protein n=1 Tax=Saezia sanguinis TaxID=1965230 RepID=A0A433SDH6_9BURK|nr:glycine betaine/L-proline ABC transporter substrate-binding protein ProX [Saezia sanguinis]RUS66799.1 Glycine betaine/proline betaine-binding periplasmic protein [Saezia sanguinis]